MDNEIFSRRLTQTAYHQFDSCYRMLETLVDVTPGTVWLETFHAVPFWYQVYHVVYFVDYWFRKDFAATDFLCMTFDKQIPPEFEHDVPEGVFIPQDEMREYLRHVREKFETIFRILDDETLAQGIGYGETQITWLDVILTQTRHIMYNVGYCNGILRGQNLAESDWYAYNETEDSSSVN